MPAVTTLQNPKKKMVGATGFEIANVCKDFVRFWDILDG